MSSKSHRPRHATNRDCAGSSGGLELPARHGKVEPECAGGGSGRARPPPCFPWSNRPKPVRRRNLWRARTCSATRPKTASSPRRAGRDQVSSRAAALTRRGGPSSRQHPSRVRRASNKKFSQRLPGNLVRWRTALKYRPRSAQPSAPHVSRYPRRTRNRPGPAPVGESVPAPSPTCSPSRAGGLRCTPELRAPMGRSRC